MSFRVISWIVLNSRQEAIHEFTRNNTKADSTCNLAHGQDARATKASPLKYDGSSSRLALHQLLSLSYNAHQFDCQARTASPRNDRFGSFICGSLVFGSAGKSGSVTAEVFPFAIQRRLAFIPSKREMCASKSLDPSTSDSEPGGKS